MAKDSTKKIDIADNVEEKEEIEIKKSKRLASLEERQDKAEKEISDFYQNKDFSFQGPSQASKGLIWLSIVWSIVFGLIAGTTASFFILTRETIKIPFTGKEIKLAEFLPTRELSLTTEKNVTVLAETRMADLVKDLSTKTVKIFKAKPEGQTGFLEQIYAPWQMLGSGAFVSSDGWLITVYNFEPETKYVAVDGENKILPIEKTINDSITGLGFCKVGEEKISGFELGQREEITAGRQAVVLDRFQNFHLTEISQSKARDILKTEDLVYSADRFSEFLRLGVFENSFPQSLIFGLDGKILGFISGEKVIPAWQVQTLVNQVLATQEIRRPFLGIDYLLINEAPGLTSPRFKDLKQGAIVYGQPGENTPALEAGIKNADVIVKVDDIILDENQNLTYLIQQKLPGDKIVLTVLRDGEEETVESVLGEK